MNFFSRVSIFRLWRQITRPYLLKTVRTFQKTPKISCFAKTKTRFFSNSRSYHHFLTKMGLNCADFNSLQIHWNNFYHETNDSWDIERFETAHRAALGSPHQFSSFELWRQSLKLDRAKRNSLLYLIYLWFTLLCWQGPWIVRFSIKNKLNFFSISNDMGIEMNKLLLHADALPSLFGLSKQNLSLKIAF